MRSFLTWVLFLLATTGIRAQLTVTNAAPYNDPAWLVQNVLVNQGVAIIPSFPAPATSTQIGYFTASGFTFGIDSGIVMISGNATDILPGAPNSTAFGSTPDAELQDMLNTITPPGSTWPINDKSVIEFDFIATGDSVKFNYIFASYEYSGYTCSNFNDPFGFFLTGYGINGNTGNSTVNIAEVPGTNPPVPVAVNTINQGFPSGGYPASNCTYANPAYATSATYYVANSGAANVNVTGYTVPLTAKAQVTCGNIYHIKLAVADVSDNALHTAVFLEAKSFSTPSIQITAAPNFGNTFIDTALVEGCNPAYIEFRKNGNVGVPMTISWTLSGSAVNGSDYQTLPASITIPAGQVADTLWIHALQDGLTETYENLILTTSNVVTPCYIYPAQVVQIWLRDANPVDPTVMVSQGDTVDCPGDAAEIYGVYSGGDGQVNFQWADGVLDSVRTVYPNANTTYEFQVWDECGDTITDSVRIYLREYTPMQANPDNVTICPGETTMLSPNYQGGTAPYTFEWDSGDTTHTLEVQPAQSAYYPFTVTDECGEIYRDSAYVFVAPKPQAQFNYIEVPDIPLRVKFIQGSVNATAYVWDFGDGGTSTDEAPSHTYSAPGTYRVTLRVTNNYGCASQYTLDVTVYQDFYLYVPSAFSPNGDGINDQFLVSGSGFESFEMRVYNRWGEQIFHSTHINHGWDGLHEGEEALQGVYSYSILLKLPFDKIYQKQGFLTLFR